MTTCPCGTTIPSEAAAQRHAAECDLQGYPRDWAIRCNCRSHIRTDDGRVVHWFRCAVIQAGVET